MKWVKKLTAAIVVLVLYSGFVAIVACGVGWSSFTEAIVYGLAIAGVSALGVLLSVGLVLLFEWAAD